MLYVAVPVHHPAIGFVRVALPLTDVRQHVRSVFAILATGLGLAFIGAALIAWVFSARIGQRVRGIADVARRYQSGDLTPTRMDFGDDELGVVAPIAGRVGPGRRTPARRTGAGSGANGSDPRRDGRRRHRGGSPGTASARQRRRTADAEAGRVGIGRPYVETIRHPAIAELVAAALLDRTPEPLQLSPPRDPSRTIIARAAPATRDAAHGVVLVMHDITDLRRADQIRRDFVANVSHELRTPLTAIRGYVEALGEEDADPEDTKRFLAIITRHTERMERLVKDLLRLARLDAGQETLAVVDARPARSPRRSPPTSRAPSRSGGRPSTLRSPGAEIVRGDPARLHDALRNLVANAITYGPEGTTVRTRRYWRAGIPEVGVFERFSAWRRAPRPRRWGGPGVRIPSSCTAAPAPESAPDDLGARPSERFYSGGRPMSRARDPPGRHGAGAGHRRSTSSNCTAAKCAPRTGPRAAFPIAAPDTTRCRVVALSSGSQNG